MNFEDLLTFFTIATFASALLLFLVYWIMKGK